MILITIGNYVLHSIAVGGLEWVRRRGWWVCEYVNGGMEGVYICRYHLRLLQRHLPWHSPLWKNFTGDEPQLFAFSRWHISWYVVPSVPQTGW